MCSEQIKQTEKVVLCKDLLTVPMYTDEGSVEWPCEEWMCKGSATGPLCTEILPVRGEGYSTGGDVQTNVDRKKKNHSI